MNIQNNLKIASRLIIKQKTIIAVVIILVVMIFTGSGFYTTFNILAFGVTLTIICGGTDLSIGSSMCLSGIVAIILMDIIPMWLAILAGIASGAAVGFINGFFVVHQKTEPFIITLGTGILIKGLCQQLTDAKPISPSNTSFVTISNGLVFGVVPNIIIVTIVLMVIFYCILRFTSFGRNCYAIGGDYGVAKYSGIDVIRIKWLTFVFSGLTAAIGGIMLSSLLNTGSSIYGDNTPLLVFCSAVVGGTSFAGGIGGIPQTAIGILLFSLLDNSMNSLLISPYVQMLTKGIVIVLIIWFDCYARKRKREAV